MQEETSACPCMPHLMYPVPGLDARYPPLVAPPDEGLVDATDDRRDAVYQHGLGIAEGIRAEVAAQGRRRRPNQECTTGGSAPRSVIGVVEELPDTDYSKGTYRNGTHFTGSWSRSTTTTNNTHDGLRRFERLRGYAGTTATNSIGGTTPSSRTMASSSSTTMSTATDSPSGSCATPTRWV